MQSLAQHARAVVLLAAASIAAYGTLVTASCSYGNYDGKYDAGPDDGGDRGSVVLVQAVDPSREQILTTPDGVFEITFPKDAFAGPTTVTIAQHAERLVDALLVPVYSVSASATPRLTVQVLFRGNNPNGGGSSRVLVAAEQTASDFLPLAVVGVGVQSGGPSTSFWGLTATLGKFSLAFQTVSTTAVFLDVASSSCLTKCCSSTNTAGFAGNSALIGNACGCFGGPNLSCFLQSCPDLVPVAARCADLGTHNAPTALECKPYGALDAGNCPGPSCQNYSGTCNATGTSAVCCVQNDTGTCLQNQGGQCNGVAIRCDVGTPCPSGTTCCVFDNEAYCTATCPSERHTCRVDTDCQGAAADSGACQDAPACPFRTCGTPPSSCL